MTPSLLSYILESSRGDIDYRTQNSCQMECDVFGDGGVSGKEKLRIGEGCHCH